METIPQLDTGLGSSMRGVVARTTPATTLHPNDRGASETSEEKRRKHATKDIDKKKPVQSTGFFMNRVSDDVLLSRARAHYHRRKSVSRSCSGWEGVVPLRYGRQTKLVGGEPGELPRLAAVV